MAAKLVGIRRVVAKENDVQDLLVAIDDEPVAEKFQKRGNYKHQNTSIN